MGQSPMVLGKERGDYMNELSKILPSAYADKGIRTKPNPLGLSVSVDEVPTTANSQKSDLAARIKPPYFCYAAITPESIYRVCFGYRTDFFHGQELYLSCDDNELFTDCLREWL